MPGPIFNWTWTIQILSRLEDEDVKKIARFLIVFVRWVFKSYFLLTATGSLIALSKIL